jgi:caffeoyl-CoA O-methyltransferase
MALLVRLMGAKRCLEIGTYTGYSALAVALALPKDGRIVCCDVSEEWTALGKPFWEKAGVSQKIDLRLAPALDTLKKLKGPFDFVFIDADKENYLNYYERCLALLRRGGLIVVDKVAATDTTSSSVRMATPFSTGSATAWRTATTSGCPRWSSPTSACPMSTASSSSRRHAGRGRMCPSS